MVERFKRMLGLVNSESRGKLESLVEQSGAISREEKEAEEAIKEAESIIRMVQKDYGEGVRHHSVEIGTMSVRVHPNRLTTFKPGWQLLECTGHLRWFPTNYSGFCWESGRDVKYGPGIYLRATNPDLFNAMTLSPLLLANPVDKIHGAQFLGRLIDRVLDQEVGSSSDDIRQRIANGNLRFRRDWR